MFESYTNERFYTAIEKIFFAIDGHYFSWIAFYTSLEIME